MLSALKLILSYLSEFAVAGNMYLTDQKVMPKAGAVFVVVLGLVSTNVCLLLCRNLLRGRKPINASNQKGLFGSLKYSVQ